MAKLKREEFDVMLPPGCTDGDGDGEQVTDAGTIDPPPPSDKKKDPKDGKGDDKDPKDDKGDDEGGDGAGKGKDGKKDAKGKGAGDEKTHDVKIEPIESGSGGILTEDQSREMQKDLGVPYEGHGMSADEIKEKINRALIDDTIPEHKGGSKQAGSGKGGLRNALAKIAKPQVDWRKALKKYIGRNPLGREEKLGHRNFIHSGDYIWTDRQKDKGAVAEAICAVDVSGSMSDDNVAIILTEIKGMVEAKKVKNTRIVYFHSDIELIVDLKGPGAVKRYQGNKVGSGGTDFRPPIEEMQAAYKKHKLEIALFLTDGHADLNLPKPKFSNKFIWVILDNPGFVPPWGNMCVYVNSNSTGKI